MTEGFLKHLNRRLRSHFTGLGAADTISYHKDSTLSVGQKRIFIKRTSFVQPAVGDGV